VNGNTIGQQTWVERWVRRIEALGLSAVAFSLLELARAFGCLGSQLLFLIQPLLAGITSDSALLRTAEMLEDPDFYEQLTQYLESKEEKIHK